MPDRPPTTRTTASGVLLLLAILAGPVAWLGRTLVSPEGDAFPPVSHGPKVADLVIVTVDGLSAGDLRLHLPEAPPPPALDALAGRGIEVLRAFGPVASAPEAVLALATGRLPDAPGGGRPGEDGADAAPQRGVAATPELATALQGPASFVQRFADAGWRCEVFCAGRGDVEGGAGAGPEGEPRRSAARAVALAQAAGAWLPGDDRQPVLAWVHLTGTESPDAARESLDVAVGTLLEALAATRRLERTVFVAAGTFGRAGTGRDGDLSVPLLLRLPRHAASGALRIGPCSTLDLAPTLLAFFDLPPLPRGEGRAWSGGAPDALLTGQGFAGTAPFCWDEPGGRVLGVRAAGAILTDEPGVYDAALDPAARINLAGTPRGGQLVAAAPEAPGALDALRRPPAPGGR